MKIRSMLRDHVMARPVRRAAALALALCAASGCAAEQDPEAEVVEEGLAPIASLHLSDGAEVHFYEPEEGHMMAFTTNKLPESLEALPPAALYEALSGQAAPPALTAAQERVDRGRLARGPRRAAVEPSVIVEDAPRPPQAGAAEGLGAAAQALSPSAFMSAHCSGPIHDIDYCWTELTVARTVDVMNVDSIAAYVDSYSGTVLMTVSIRNAAGNWVPSFSRTVTATGGVIPYANTADHSYRVAVSQVDPTNSYHLAIRADR